MSRTFAISLWRGLKDTFSHVEVIYFFDKVPVEKIETNARHPRNNKEWPLVGIFAQRGKNRPNRIGISFSLIVPWLVLLIRMGRGDNLQGSLGGWYSVCILVVAAYSHHRRCRYR